MKALVTLTNKELESSSGTTAEWKSTFTKTKNLLTKMLKGFGCTNIEINRGHFYLSGFYTAPSGQIYYISMSDFRDFGGIKNMLVRTAKSYKDYSGGGNNWVSIANIEEEIQRFTK